MRKIFHRYNNYLSCAEIHASVARVIFILNPPLSAITWVPIPDNQHINMWRVVTATTANGGLGTRILFAKPP